MGFLDRSGARESEPQSVLKCIGMVFRFPELLFKRFHKAPERAVDG